MKALEEPGVVAEDAMAELANNLSERLAETGDDDGALRWAQEAVDRFRRLEQGDPRFAIGLVIALNELPAECRWEGVEIEEVQ